MNVVRHRSADTRERVRWVLVFFALLILSASWAGAQVAATQSAAEARPAATSEVKTDGKGKVGALQVSIDPATGRLRPPTAAEAQALLAQMQLLLADDGAGLTETVWPDGTVSVDLEGRFQSVALATLDPESGVVTHCVTDPSALPAAAQQKPAAPALEEK